jgi:hypothetical protein
VFNPGVIMKRFISAAVCVVFLAAPGALAQAPSAGQAAAPAAASGFTGYSVGTITSVNAAAGTLTLQDGRSYSVSGSVTLAGLMVGQTVTIAFVNQDGKLVITSIARSAG